MAEMTEKSTWSCRRCGTKNTFRKLVCRACAYKLGPWIWNQD